MCGNCNGSGEGMYDGSRCYSYSCNGSGVDEPSDDNDDYYGEPDDDSDNRLSCEIEWDGIR